MLWLIDARICGVVEGQRLPGLGYPTEQGFLKIVVCPDLLTHLSPGWHKKSLHFVG